MFGGRKASLAPDRFNRPLSALSLNTGYYKIPAGNYFPNGDFTIAFWVKLRQIVEQTRFLEFGPNSPPYAQSFLVTSSGTFVYCWQNMDCVQTTQSLSVNQWYHLSFVQRDTNLSIYVNAVTWASGILAQTNSVRTENYLGRAFKYSCIFLF